MGEVLGAGRRSPVSMTSLRCSSAASSPSKAICIRSWRTSSTSRMCWPPPRKANARKDAAAQPAARGEPKFEPIVGRYLNMQPARPPASPVCRGGRSRHSAALPAHRRLRRTAVSRPAQRRAWTKNYRVIVFDMPWHGKSSPPEGYQNEEYQLTSKSYIQMILEIADALKLDKPGGDGLLDRRTHRALPRAPARGALSRHHRTRIRAARGPILRP